MIDLSNDDTFTLGVVGICATALLAAGFLAGFAVGRIA